MSEIAELDGIYQPVFYIKLLKCCRRSLYKGSALVLDLAHVVRKYEAALFHRSSCIHVLILYEPVPPTADLLIE